jgi:hypothetical protein
MTAKRYGEGSYVELGRWGAKKLRRTRSSRLD